MPVLDLSSLAPTEISRDLKGKYLMLYGKQKVGKTSFAVQAPRALVMAFELGGNALSGINLVPIPKWSDFKSYLSQLRRANIRDKFDTIVIDTVSIAWSLCEKYICQQAEVNELREIPWGQGWNRVKEEFQEALREITMLGYGLILICHSKEKQSEYTDGEGNAIVAVEPDLPKNAYNICNAICDIIGYINVEFPDPTSNKSVRYLYTRQTPTIFAGSRYKYLETKIPFGYQELVDAIGKAIDKSVDLDGAKVGENSSLQAALNTKTFAEVMEEAKTCWNGYLASAADDEERASKLAIMKDVVKKIFGSDSFKISAAVPSQQDLVELFVTTIKDM